MADVTPADRGQILLISALVIATVFVGLAVVVNSGIYTENIATRETGSEAGAAALAQQSLSLDLQELIDHSNAVVAADDYAAVTNTYDDDLDAWAEGQERRYGRTGRYVEYTKQSTVEGTRIHQENASRNFTAGGSISGESDWTLVDGATRAGVFELVIQRESLLDSATYLLSDVLDTAFYISIETDSGETWNIYFVRGLSPEQGILFVERPSGFSLDLDETLDDLDASNVCTSTEGTITVDVANASFGGTHCKQLEFYQDDVVGSPHQISYNNTETGGGVLGLDLEPRVVGTYDVIVDTRADRTPYHGPTTSRDPTANAVIYEASVEMTYRSSSVTYQNTGLEAKWSKVA